MSIVTKEWLLKTIAELEEERDAVPGVVNEDAAKALAAMKLALASLEAEPVSFDDLRDAVAEVSGGPAMEWSEIYKGHQAVPFINFNSLARIVDKFRAAPPAPVSVPDAMDDQGGVCCEVSYADGWNACRAAMLQNGNSPAQSDCCPAQNCIAPAQNCIAPALGGNSPVIADGWVACSERMPEQFVEVLVCTEDGSRYVAALNQSMNWDDGDFFDDIQYVTHWMPLPAAPQQEAK